MIIVEHMIHLVSFNIASLSKNVSKKCLMITRCGLMTEVCYRNQCSMAKLVLYKPFLSFKSHLIDLKQLHII